MDVAGHRASKQSVSPSGCHLESVPQTASILKRLWALVYNECPMRWLITFLIFLLLIGHEPPRACCLFAWQNVRHFFFFLHCHFDFHFVGGD